MVASYCRNVHNIRSRILEREKFQRGEREDGRRPRFHRRKECTCTGSGGEHRRGTYREELVEWHPLRSRAVFGLIKEEVSGNPGVDKVVLLLMRQPSQVQPKLVRVPS